MLTDPHRRLVALAVDGQLTPAESDSFRALVSESSEALSLFHALQSHSARLAALPRPPLPRQKSVRILQAVAALPAPAASVVRAPAAARPGRVSWLPYAVAASTLLAVTAGTYWAAQRSGPRAPGEPGESARLAAPPSEIAPAGQGGLAAADSPAAPLPAPREVPQVAHAKAAPAPEVAPAPRLRPAGEVVGSGVFLQSPDLTAIEVRLPTLTSVSRFDLPDVRKLVAADLHPDALLRIDLFSRETPRGAQALFAAAKAAGVSVTVDAVAAERIKKNLPLTWAVYADSLSPADLSRLLDHLASANRDAGKDAPFGAAHVAPGSAADAKELREAFGVELTAPKRAAAPSTADQLAAALAKQSKTAVAATFAPPLARAAPSSSAELRAFLAARGDRRPGATPVLLVVRPAN